MHHLSNDQLTVTLLDPVADADRFGPRYCTGGYVFQVEDARLGPLLTGPTYPDSFNWFDGQGLPDTFHQSPLRGEERSDTLALVLGIGVCDLATKRIVAPCPWAVTIEGTTATYSTAHEFDGWEVTLDRTVALHGRSVVSTTHLRNPGRMLRVAWFPHPFYPQPAGPDLFRTNVPFTFAHSEGYTIEPNGWVGRRVLSTPDHPGYYQALEIPDGAGPATFVQRHDLLGTVSATTSYSPTMLPIWGNARTFSFEPFLDRTLAQGQELRWSMSYDF